MALCFKDEIWYFFLHSCLRPILTLNTNPPLHLTLPATHPPAAVLLLLTWQQLTVWQLKVAFLSSPGSSAGNKIITQETRSFELGVLGHKQHFVFIQNLGVCYSCREQVQSLLAIVSTSLNILENVFSSGSGARTAACSHGGEGGGTLKGTKFSNCYECFLISRILMHIINILKIPST